LSIHLCFSLSSDLFPSGFPTISYMHSYSHHSCYMPRSSHPSWLHHSNYTWRRVQVMKFSPTSCHFIPLWSKCKCNMTNITFIKVEFCTIRGGSVNSLLLKCELCVMSDKWPYKRIHRSVNRAFQLIMKTNWKVILCQ
jgi:hypothetical protein